MWHLSAVVGLLVVGLVVILICLTRGLVALATLKTLAEQHII